jgi:hypothetical protein
MLGLWWERNRAAVFGYGLVIAATVLVYHRGAASVAPHVAAAKGQTAVATANGANAKGALAATSERQKVDVTIRAIERETGNVIAEARITGDVNTALDGWATGIDRMRGVVEDNPDADPHKRP